MLLGSTTARVLNGAECPVLTTQHAQTVAPRSLEHRTWICAIGSSPDSVRVLQLARSAASEVGANLFVVHAVGADSVMSEPAPESEQRESARLDLRDLAASAGYPGEVRILRGPVKEALLSALSESRADVLVVGRSAPSEVLGRMGDLAYALIRDSVCPVMSV
jgi:nucleotide-binding universal stress UspA family protein